MDKVISWLGRNGTAFVAFAIGLVLGIFIWKPEGWKLPDPVLTLIGSIAGSIFTVGGAFLLWQAQDRKQSTNVKSRIAQQIIYLYIHQKNVVRALRQQGSQSADARDIDLWHRGLQKATSRIGAIDIYTLPRREMEGFFGIELLLEELQSMWLHLRRDHEAGFGRSPPLGKTRTGWADYFESIATDLEEHHSLFSPRRTPMQSPPTGSS